MNNLLNYYQDPGIVFDIIKMLMVKLYPNNAWKTALTTIESKEDDIEFIQYHAASLPDPKLETLLFIHIPANRTVSFLTTVVSKLLTQGFTSFSIENLISYFDNITQVTEDLYSYYLGDQDYKNTDFEYLIRSSKTIPDKVRILLLGFSLSPQKFTSYLTKTLHTYSTIIKEKWLISSEISLIPPQFLTFLINDYNSTNDEKIHDFKTKSLSYSLCLTTPQFLYYNLTSDFPFFITTSKTITQSLSDQKPKPFDSILDITSALNDKHRLAIITQLVAKQTISLQELIQTLNLSSSAIIHHVSILKKANLVTSSRINRKVIYTFNPDGFSDLIQSLQKLMKGEYLK